MTTRISITEEQFLDQLIDLCHLYEWRCAHFRPAWTSKGWRTAIQGHAGFPDLVLVKPGRQVIFAEVKRDGAQLSPAQIEWGQALIAAGAIWFIWRPKDFDAIDRLLRGGR